MTVAPCGESMNELLEKSRSLQVSVGDIFTPATRNEPVVFPTISRADISYLSSTETWFVGSFKKTTAAEEDAGDLIALRDSLKGPGADVDFRAVRKELDF